MTRPVCFQVYISNELSSAIRKAAKARRLSMSEWVRSLIAEACEEERRASGFGASIDRISRQSVFLMVSVDALLAGHPDRDLRTRAHKAYARKCKELGLIANAGEGGSDEA